MPMTPQEVKLRLGEGLLAFPVTHFDNAFAFDETPYREHVERLVGHGPAGLFAAGGTGEFFSLALGEYERVVAAAVEQTAGRVPVIAGCGYGTRIAMEFAAAAECAGADGLLLLPPYLIGAEQVGLESHVKAVCKSTSRAVIVYNRDNCVLREGTLERLARDCANLVGFKDGLGNIELMARIRGRLGDRLTYIGGLPTAETFAAPYLELGATTYSSAVFNFLPEMAQSFYTAVRARDRKTIDRLLEGFFFPYLDIRDRRKGYAVSIVKAGMRAVGWDAGPVRAPLLDLTPEEQSALDDLVDRFIDC